MVGLVAIRPPLAEPHPPYLDPTSSGRRLALSDRYLAARYSHGSVRVFHLPFGLHLFTFFPLQRDAAHTASSNSANANPSDQDPLTEKSGGIKTDDAGQGAISMKATFFITYIMVDGWAGIASEILRLKPLVIFHLKNTFLVKTVRDRERAINPGSVDFPETLPSLQLYFLLGIVYTVVTPIL
ncbi:CSC1-like protein [Camellia lanceoleosa]|uniref:CSC1-like protein n=1 Tax=Camellia lanceoleosa TaxID=1840588 RepID=A0ACC0H6I9_9ERIC|nr:CSC1-like protein [Camellia lanceoleosa]